MQQPDPRSKQLCEKLTRAYWAEVETVMNYLAASINPDGIRARGVREVLAADVQEELGHAQQFGDRIKELYGVVPGSMSFRPDQSYLQPPEDQTDLKHLIKGVIEAERGAIAMYEDIVEFCDDFDLVTQDMVIGILHDEQKHLRMFEGFMREFETDKAQPVRA